MRDEPKAELKCRTARSFQIPQKVLIHTDSRTVVMEVEIR